MTTIDLRNTIKEYVNTADTRLKKMIKALAESYQKDKEELTLSAYNIHAPKTINLKFIYESP